MPNFLFGTLFGVILVPISDFLSHVFWNYIFPESWRAIMGEPMLSITKFIFLVVLAVFILTIFIINNRRQKKLSQNKEKESDGIEKKLDRIIELLEGKPDGYSKPTEPTK